VKKLMIAVLIVTQSLVGASPAFAGTRDMWGPNPILISQPNTDQIDRVIRAQYLTVTQQRETGVFGGFRLRIVLGGSRHQPKVRGGLTVAPSLHGRGRQEEANVNIAEGLELGFRSGQPISLFAGGQNIGGHRRTAAQAGQEDGEEGLPDWALVAGGMIIALGVGGSHSTRYRKMPASKRAWSRRERRFFRLGCEPGRRGSHFRTARNSN